MRITFEGIVLRDYQSSDIEDEIRWTNVETDWFSADTPWMTMEKVDPDELRTDMMEIMNSITDDKIRWRFEIEVDERHIGIVSSSYLYENFEHVPWALIDQTRNAEYHNAIRVLGIEICEMDCWGKGIGTKALTAFMEYYRSLGEHRFLLETWSGNKRMLGCAQKLGFSEIKRDVGAYTVGGGKYDAIVLEKRFND